MDSGKDTITEPGSGDGPVTSARMAVGVERLAPAGLGADWWDTIRGFLRFLVVGVGNTVIGLSVIFGAMFVGVNPFAANALGYAAGLIFGYHANRAWTFRSRDPALMKYLAVILLAYGMNLLLVAVALWVFRINAYAAQLLGMGAYTMLSFLGCKVFVFAPRSVKF